MTIGLIGSQNAGKSTLFNRLINTYRAIITDIAGTTRDILRHQAMFDGIGEIEVLDSPGLDEHEDELPLVEKIIADSDCIILVIDAKIGINSKDEAMLSLVRRVGKISQTILFLNKLDTKLSEDQYALLTSDYVYLGLDHVVVGSAHHGKIDELKRTIYGILSPSDPNAIDEDESDEDMDNEREEEIETEEDATDDEREEEIFESIDKEDTKFDTKHIKVAIVGRPNVGKSTLINQITQQPLSKVSEIPGTTLDYISHTLTIQDTSYTLYDTAGIRRKGSIHGLEKIAFDKTHGMLKYYQPIVLFLIDGSEGVTQSDRALMGNIMNLHLPTLVIINKIDLLDNKQKKTLLTAVEEHFGHRDRFFTVGISAKSGQGIEKIRPIINDIRIRAHRSLTTGQLNKAIKTAFLTRPPTFPQLKPIKVYYTTQVQVYPPVFMSFINKKKNLTGSFENRLDTAVREAGKFKGIALQFLFRDKQMDEEGYNKHLRKRKEAVKARLKSTPAEKIAAKKKAEERKKKKGKI